MPEQEVKNGSGEEEVPEERSRDGKVKYYRTAFIVLALVGLAVSLELTRVWVKVRTDPSYESICAVNRELNCMTVAESKYSAFLGVPVSVWGVAGYLAMLAVAMFYYSGKKPRRGLAVCLNGALAFFSVITGLVLLYISEVMIQVLCPFCISIYVINVLILPLALLIFFKEGGTSSLKAVFSQFGDIKNMARYWAPVLVSALVVSALAVGVFLSVFSDLHAGPPQPCREEQNIPTIEGGLKVGFTEEGHPWIGAADPQAVISEFTDYQCPYCDKSHADLRKMLPEYKEKIRVVHRHLPLDNDCHPLVKREYHPCACRYSRYAICAAEQGATAFWKMNDYLFGLPRQRECVGREKAASDTGLDRDKFFKCLDSEFADKKLHDDIMESIDLEIFATPTYVCDGNTLPGTISKKSLDKIIDECSEKGPESEKDGPKPEKQ
jgi:protein-disulfide isomerase/uncharacterized membrane protein